MLSSTYGLYSSVDPTAIPQFAPEGFYVASDEKRPYHTRIHHAAAGTATTHNPAGAHSREFPAKEVHR